MDAKGNNSDLTNRRLLLSDKSRSVDVKAAVFLAISFVLFFAFAFPFLRDDKVGSDEQFGLFFREMEDYLADFFNVCKYSAHKDPYFSTENGFEEKAYFPISYLICFIATRFMRSYSPYPDLEVTDYYWATTFVTLCVVSIAVATYATVRGSIVKKALTTLAVVISGPTLYTIERGNLILISITGMLIFTATYSSDDKRLRHAGYIALAIASAIKGYPAILGMLLIYRKKWKEAGILAAYGAAFAFGPFLFLENGFANIPKWLDNLRLNTEHYEFLEGDKIGYRFFIANNTDLSLDAMKDIRDVMNLIVLIVAVLAVLSAFAVKKDWLRYLMLITVIFIYPANNAYYVVMYLIPLVVLLLNEEKNDPFVISTLVICAFMLMPYRITGDIIFFEASNTLFVINIIVIAAFFITAGFCISGGAVETYKMLFKRTTVKGESST